MTMNNMYVGIETLTMDPCYSTDADYAEAKRTWLCTGCCAPKPDVQRIDVHLVEAPRREPLNFVSGCGLGVVYKPFLDRFPEYLVHRDLYLGRVYGPDGEELTDWRTYRGRRRIIIRGTQHASVRECDKCGQKSYFAMGRKYLYPEPPQDVTIFESAGGGGFVVPEELFAQLSIGKPRKLRIDRLQVLDPPPDGLGELKHP